MQRRGRRDRRDRGIKVEVHLLTSPELLAETVVHGGPPAGGAAAWLAAPHTAAGAAAHTAMWMEPEEVSFCSPPAFSSPTPAPADMM